MAESKIIVIRNKKSGLVLDASDGWYVKLQHFTGSSFQKWQIEEADDGIIFLSNPHNGHVLDIDLYAKPGQTLITYPKHGGLNQQWRFFGDGTIVSAVDNLAVDIDEANFEAGNRLIAWPKHGRANQQFHQIDSFWDKSLK